MSESTLRSWTPVLGNDLRSKFGRIVSIPNYLPLAPYAIFFHGKSTVANARWWRNFFAVTGLAGCVAGHAMIHRRWGSVPSSKTNILSHVLWALSWDRTYYWLYLISHELIEIFSIDRKTNRLEDGRLYGPRVLVMGNGPSAAEGEQYGEEIDKFDEVVRFNNFQAKIGGLEKWVGTKTTVHFSDALLSPTFSEYHVPSATIVLSLFVDRYFVSGSYIILRAGADLRWNLTMQFMKDPGTTWIKKENIDRLRKALGLTGAKHPTSGMLAIDYFVNKPGVQLPVIIHGFDFFMGPKIHYFHDHEPLYERINNNIGVNMHSPHREKIYVEKLIEEGKVMFLKDAQKLRK